jgi:hypothetical protein
VAEQAFAAKRSDDKDDEVEPARDEARGDEGADDAQTQSEESGPAATAWAIRGAVVGAIAGGAAGAGIGAVLARSPDALNQAKAAIAANGKQIARAAAAAATEAVTAKGLSQLVSGDGNGDRSKMVKQTAREAGAAAAKGARDAIISLRREGTR